MLQLCRERCQSYAAFRLHVFKQLWDVGCGTSSQCQSPRTPFQPNRIDRPLHTSSPNLKHGRGPNTVKNSRRQRELIRRVASEARRFGKWRKKHLVIRRDERELKPYSYFRPSAIRQELLRAERKEIVGDKPAIESAKNVIQRPGTELHEVHPLHGLGEKIDPLLKGGGAGSGAWNPYTEKGKADITSLMAELEIMTKHAITKPRTIVERAEEASEAGQRSFVIPIRSFSSPIERRIDHQEKRKQPKQLLAIENRNSPVYRNPWARMLASPIRHDQGTKARLPKSLMTTWGLVRNPKDLQDHLMPIELSNLQILREWIDQAESSSSVPVLQDLESLQKPPEGERVYIQPNTTLVQAITKEVLKKPSGHKAKSHVASSVLTTSLIPWRWSEAINRADTYRKTQTIIDPVTGGEKVDNEWREHVPNLSSLQWQPDIDSRLRLILAERVLIALDGLARKNSTAAGIRAKRVYAMDIPDSGRLVIDAQHIVPDTEISHKTTDQTTTQDADHGELPTWLPGSFFVHIGTPEQYTNTVSRWQQQEHHPNTLPEAKQSRDTLATNNFPDLPHDNYIPPTIALTSSKEQLSSLITRLPVFNLSTLLGPSFTSRIEQVICNQEHSILDYRFWSEYDVKKQEYLASKVASQVGSSEVAAHEDHSSTDSQPGDVDSRRDHNTAITSSNEQRDLQTNKTAALDKEYIVLVKGNAAKGDTLLAEIWQLWRYLGGKEGLKFDNDDHAKDDIPSS